MLTYKFLNKKLSTATLVLFSLFSFQFIPSSVFAMVEPEEEEPAPVYAMKTAEIIDSDVVFASPEDFEEVLKVGFFRIKRPADIKIEISAPLHVSLMTSQSTQALDLAIQSMAISRPNSRKPFGLPWSETIGIRNIGA